MTYDPIIFHNDSAPAINASSLNYMQGGIEAAHTHLASQAALVASTLGFASMIAGNLGDSASSIDAMQLGLASQNAALLAIMETQELQGDTMAAQTGAVASSTAAVATAMPLLDSLADDVGAMSPVVAANASQVAAQATQMVSLGSSVAAVAGQLTDLEPQLTLLDGVATQLAVQATQMSALPGLAAGAAYANRSGNGPVDLWDSNIYGVVMLPTTVSCAVGVRYVPPAPVAATGLASLHVLLTPNTGIGVPTGQFALGVLDGSGEVLAWSVPTAVPALASVTDIRVPLAVPASGLVPGEPYFFVAAADDQYGFTPLGLGFNGQQDFLHEQGLIYQWPLTSLNLASQGSFPLDVASSMAPLNVPAIFA